MNCCSTCEYNGGCFFIEKPKQNFAGVEYSEEKLKFSEEVAEI